METHDANYGPSLEDLNLNNALFAMMFADLIVHGKETYGQSDKEVELYATNIAKRKQAIKKIEQQALSLDTKEAEEHLACHGMPPNHLFGMDLETPTEEAMAAVLDLSGNSPQKKKTKSAAGILWTGNQYTTKGFSIPPTTHVYSHLLTYVEATIYLTSEDKPKEFILEIKLLLLNVKFLDQNFSLTPLKNLPGKQTKIIIAEDNIPSNITVGD
jgi:hypothetical protein